MQIAKATSVLVNRGDVIAPHLLRATIDNSDTFENAQLASFVTYPPITGVKDRFWDIAVEGMRLVNHGTRGTARRAFRNTPYTSAGKSGTAQVFGLAEDQKYNAEEIAEHLRDHALFTGFAPIEDPKLIVTIVLENAGSGSSKGGSVVRKIFDHVLVAHEEVD